ncbi:hypothetical protein V5O48_001697 [Marasmius crinis-equi]|uniref:Ino eighty subunit 1 n=1 Tax=Marasmius crinis-equi TaxID=585013 RepID=A0ABR3FXL0_9AGAR
MAFFPEMKTALRTYHPVPSLQKTDGNAQDAPRIKNCLKAALLPSEVKSTPPSTPDEVLDKLRAGLHPPTSVVNLIFVLSNHTAPTAAAHFDGTFNFLDLFIPKELSSSDRARTFLWLIYHYLESPEGPNPFDDAYSRNNPPKAPFMRILTPDEMANENVDTREEIEWGKKKSVQRNAFLRKLVSSLETEKKNKAAAPHFVPATPHSTASTSSGRTHTPRRSSDTAKEEAAFMYYVPGHEQAPNPSGSSSVHRQTTRSQPEEVTRPIASEPKTWHSILNSDPLLDSDEEGSDEHIRADYARRLEVLTRLRGKTPTPDLPESTQPGRAGPGPIRWHRQSG